MMVEKINEVFIVWEISPDYPFSSVHFEEEGAKTHVELRKKYTKSTEMDGREIFYKKYVVLE